MPGDLRSPETSAFPTYYDPKYDQVPNQFEPGSFDVDGYIKSIVFENLRQEISQAKLNEIKQKADDKGLFHLNLGDELFRSGILDLMKKRKMARKVIANARQ